MEYRDKLKRLQHLTGKTQTEMAELLGVSFPTMNSWLHAKSIPRKRTKIKIDLLYQDYTGKSTIDMSELEQIKQAIDSLRKQVPNPLKVITSRKDLYDAFVLELTYHTNSIEGSTLNEPQVKAVIFDNATIPDKTVVEHQEAKNHQAALGYLFRILQEGKEAIDEDDIKKLHSILMNGIWPNAGQYRDHPVRIVGSNVVTANYIKVPELMAGLVKVMNDKPKSIFTHLAATHAQFEQIHPFSDGNGRVGRLLMHFIALQHGLPPVFVRREKKISYYTYLERAQTDGNTAFLESFVCDGVLGAYRLLR